MIIAAIAFVIGALALAQNLVYRKFWAGKIKLELSFSSRAAVEGDGLFLVEIITNRKLLPLPWLAVKFQVSRNLLFADMENARVSDDFYRNDLFNILPYRRITRRLPFVCGKRGVYKIKSAELVSGDILNAIKLAMPAECLARLTVYPKLIDMSRVLTSDNQTLGEVLAKRFTLPDPFEFKGIREYQPFDGMRSVNRNATAKTGRLMVNINDFTVTQETVLILNLAPYSAYPDEGLFEQTIRLAASLAFYYAGIGVSVGLVSNAGTSGITGKADDAVKSIISFSCGAGRGHADNIREVLAHIDLTRSPNISCAEMLAEEKIAFEAGKRGGRRKSYILLSTDCRQEIAEGFDELPEAGAEALWLAPVREGEEAAEEREGRVTVRL